MDSSELSVGATVGSPVGTWVGFLEGEAVTAASAAQLRVTRRWVQGSEWWAVESDVPH